AGKSIAQRPRSRLQRPGWSTRATGAGGNCFPSPCAYSSLAAPDDRKVPPQFDPRRERAVVRAGQLELLVLYLEQGGEQPDLAVQRGAQVDTVRNAVERVIFESIRGGSIHLRVGVEEIAIGQAEVEQ